MYTIWVPWVSLAPALGGTSATQSTSDCDLRVTVMIRRGEFHQPYRIIMDKHRMNHWEFVDLMLIDMYNVYLCSCTVATSLCLWRVHITTHDHCNTNLAQWTNSSAVERCLGHDQAKWFEHCTAGIHRSAWALTSNGAPGRAPKGPPHGGSFYGSSQCLPLVFLGSSNIR